MTTLDGVVMAALRILTDLDEGRTTAASAEAQLTAVATAAGLRIRLIEDTEAYDGSVHHDVIVRGPGQPTVSLSVASAPGLPWPLRGVARPREHDLVEVNGEPTSVADAVACLDGMFDDVRLLRSIVDANLMGQALDEHGLDLSPRELQEATDAYRRAHGLYSAEATATWLRDNGLTPTLLARHVEQYASVAKLRRHVVGADVDRWFAEHRAELDLVTVAWATGPADDGSGIGIGIGADPLAAITSAWRAGREAGVQRWRVGDLPAGFAPLATAAVGEATAVERGGEAAVAVVVDRQPAEQDAATLETAERRLFDAWLAERRAAARVTWFWGDRRRTERALDAGG
jgi:putative peptide maturation system protein